MKNKIENDGGFDFLKGKNSRGVERRRLEDKRIKKSEPRKEGSFNLTGEVKQNEDLDKLQQQYLWEHTFRECH